MARREEETERVERLITVKSKYESRITLKKIKKERRWGKKKLLTNKKDTSTAKNKSETIFEGDDGRDLLNLVRQLDGCCGSDWIGEGERVGR